jgi:hypothetical protein
MMIWRNLDPKLLGELLLEVAQAFAAKRKARCNENGRLPPFRPAAAMEKAVHRPRSRDQV